MGAVGAESGVDGGPSGRRMWGRRTRCGHVTNVVGQRLRCAWVREDKDDSATHTGTAEIVCFLLVLHGQVILFAFHHFPTQMTQLMSAHVATVRFQ